MRETRECPVCGSISDAHKITCTWMPPNRGVLEPYYFNADPFDKWREELDPEHDLTLDEAKTIYQFCLDSPNREWQCLDAGCRAYNNGGNVFCWHCDLPRGER
jgi:hypothetical protein